MKRIISVLALTLLWSLPVKAETYTWTDKSGTVNFSDDYSSIPKQYRRKVRKLGDMDAAPAAADTAKDGGGQQPVRPSTSVIGNPGTAGADSANGLYGGKKAEVWQQEFKAREAEYKRLERELTQLEGLIKNPVGISQERMWGLPQEFRETQKRYNEAIKSYNDLNDAANKVGLPAELRK
ncbi:DUF4124 domain-containing protein [Geobacter sp. AOG2]|uniref:DUF4124 domain-containing protein n=1 Tax=Geobacter sp. AOG2 TaxID=1566347 RepID=UPI001CC3477B|nr:DUF4124 domain-containing protein [Geobacter sp. AOG2]GFE60920.1 hypothetical protein AOG2_15070 [Geobacter sp. AOG2]